MSKSNTQGRTKKGIVSSSSSIAAKQLQLNIADGVTATASFIGFSTDSSVILDMPSDLPDVVSSALTHLSKKDPATRLRALSDVRSMLLPGIVESWKPHKMLPVWCALYSKLVDDDDRRVRESANVTLGVISKVVGRKMGPYVRKLMPAWLIFQHDSAADVKNAATKAFEETFSPEKRHQAYTFEVENTISALVAKVKPALVSVRQNIVVDGSSKNEIDDSADIDDESKGKKKKKKGKQKKGKDKDKERAGSGDASSRSKAAQTVCRVAVSSLESLHDLLIIASNSTTSATEVDVTSHNDNGNGSVTQGLNFNSSMDISNLLQYCLSLVSSTEDTARRSSFKVISCLIHILSPQNVNMNDDSDLKHSSNANLIVRNLRLLCNAVFKVGLRDASPIVISNVWECVVTLISNFGNGHNTTNIKSKSESSCSFCVWDLYSISLFLDDLLFHFGEGGPSSVSPGASYPSLLPLLSCLPLYLSNGKHHCKHRPLPGFSSSSSSKDENEDEKEKGPFNFDMRRRTDRFLFIGQLLDCVSASCSKLMLHDHSVVWRSVCECIVYVCEREQEQEGGEGEREEGGSPSMLTAHILSLFSYLLPHSSSNSNSTPSSSYASIHAHTTPTQLHAHTPSSSVSSRGHYSNNNSYGYNSSASSGSSDIYDILITTLYTLHSMYMQHQQKVRCREGREEEEREEERGGGGEGGKLRSWSVKCVLDGVWSALKECSVCAVDRVCGVSGESAVSTVGEEGEVSTGSIVPLLNVAHSFPIELLQCVCSVVSGIRKKYRDEEVKKVKKVKKEKEKNTSEYSTYTTTTTHTPTHANTHTYIDTISYAFSTMLVWLSSPSSFSSSSIDGDDDLKSKQREREKKEREREREEVEEQLASIVKICFENISLNELSLTHSKHTPTHTLSTHTIHTSHSQALFTTLLQWVERNALQATPSVKCWLDLDLDVESGVELCSVGVGEGVGEGEKEKEKSVKRSVSLWEVIVSKIIGGEGGGGGVEEGRGRGGNVKIKKYTALLSLLQWKLEHSVECEGEGVSSILDDWILHTLSTLYTTPYTTSITLQVYTDVASHKLFNSCLRSCIVGQIPSLKIANPHTILSLSTIEKICAMTVDFIDAYLAWRGVGEGEGVSEGVVCDALFISELLLRWYTQQSNPRGEKEEGVEEEKKEEKTHTSHINITKHLSDILYRIFQLSSQLELESGGGEQKVDVERKVNGVGDGDGVVVRKRRERMRVKVEREKRRVYDTLENQSSLVYELYGTPSPYSSSSSLQIAAAHGSRNMNMSSEDINVVNSSSSSSRKTTSVSVMDAVDSSLWNHTHTHSHLHLHHEHGNAVYSGGGSAQNRANNGVWCYEHIEIEPHTTHTHYTLTDLHAIALSSRRILNDYLIGYLHLHLCGHFDTGTDENVNVTCRDRDRGKGKGTGNHYSCHSLCLVERMLHFVLDSNGFGVFYQDQEKEGKRKRMKEKERKRSIHCPQLLYEQITTLYTLSPQLIANTMILSEKAQCVWSSVWSRLSDGVSEGEGECVGCVDFCSLASILCHLVYEGEGVGEGGKIFNTNFDSILYTTLYANYIIGGEGEGVGEWVVANWEHNFWRYTVNCILHTNHSEGEGEGEVHTQKSVSSLPAMLQRKRIEHILSSLFKSIRSMYSVEYRVLGSVVKSIVCSGGGVGREWVEQWMLNTYDEFGYESCQEEEQEEKEKEEKDRTNLHIIHLCALLEAFYIGEIAVEGRKYTIPTHSHSAIEMCGSEEWMNRMYLTHLCVSGEGGEGGECRGGGGEGVCDMMEDTLHYLQSLMLYLESSNEGEGEGEREGEEKVKVSRVVELSLSLFAAAICEIENLELIIMKEKEKEKEKERKQTMYKFELQAVELKARLANILCNTSQLTEMIDHCVYTLFSILLGGEGEGGESVSSSSVTCKYRAQYDNSVLYSVYVYSAYVLSLHGNGDGEEGGKYESLSHLTDAILTTLQAFSERLSTRVNVNVNQHNVPIMENRILHVLNLTLNSISNQQYLKDSSLFDDICKLMGARNGIIREMVSSIVERVLVWLAGKERSGRKRRRRRRRRRESEGEGDVFCISSFEFPKSILENIRGDMDTNHAGKGVGGGGDEKERLISAHVGAWNAYLACMEVACKLGGENMVALAKYITQNEKGGGEGEGGGVGIHYTTHTHIDSLFELLVAIISDSDGDGVGDGIGESMSGMSVDVDAQFNVGMDSAMYVYGHVNGNGKYVDTVEDSYRLKRKGERQREREIFSIHHSLNDLSLLTTSILHLFRRVCIVLPGNVRNWYNLLSDRLVMKKIERITGAFISPFIIRREIEAVKSRFGGEGEGEGEGEGGGKVRSRSVHSVDDYTIEDGSESEGEEGSEGEGEEGRIEVQCSSTLQTSSTHTPTHTPSSSYIRATYTHPVQDVKLELIIDIPPTYPLCIPTISPVQKIGVSDVLWNRWLLQISTLLTASQRPGGWKGSVFHGSIADAIYKWSVDVRKQLAGVEECMVCLFVLDSDKSALPRMKCRTCKKLFHASCLYKWFTTSGRSECPLCRSPF